MQRSRGVSDIIGKFRIMGRCDIIHKMVDRSTSQVSCYCLVNKDEYIIYYAYTSVQSVITFDRLGRCFRFVYIYVCILM